MKTRQIIFFYLFIFLTIGSSQADDDGDHGFNWWDWFAWGTTPDVVNLAPTITGDPATEVNVGELYSFTPTATDPEGSALTFSIANLPGWASFNQLNGTLSGIPSSTDVGLYDAIQISVFDGVNTASLGPISIRVNPVVVPDLAPSISGNPAATVNVGQLYSFTPTASDPEGSPLTFNITNLPVWANFNPSDGTLSGIPSNNDIGLYQGIVISVFDGTNTSSLEPISITVNTTASATLSWAIPTTRTDGTPLLMSEVDGYRIYMGETSSQLNLIMDLNSSITTSYTVTDLLNGTYYFAVTTYDIQGNESAFSNIAGKTIF
jgi:hypothetical protein